MIDVHGRLVFTVCSLISGRSERAHAARLLFYRDGKNGAPLSPAERNIMDRTEVQFEVIDLIADIGRDPNDVLLYLHVVLVGLPDATHWTWHPLDTMHQDVP